jgi:GDPmannose 4,6-dehydratase
MKRAIITGITGQDGSYLTELLLAKDYTVHGLVRPRSIEGISRLDHLTNDTDIFGTRLFLYYGDLFDKTCLHNIIQTVMAP